MIDFKKCAEETFANKIANKFPTNDLKHEFSLLKGEVNELEEEVEGFLNGTKNIETLAKEMADVVIFVINMAQIANVDLEKAILEKIEYNKNRTYKKGTFRLNDPIDELYENDDDETKRLVESDFFKKDNHSMCLLP